MPLHLLMQIFLLLADYSLSFAYNAGRILKKRLAGVLRLGRATKQSARFLFLPT